jgi:PAS domain S-box-containing protein
LLLFISVQTLVFFNLCDGKHFIAQLAYISTLLFIFPFLFVVKELIVTRSEVIKVNNLIEFEKFVDSSVLISRADKHGNITYVNKKFEEVSGWKLNDIIGKNHSVLNSGYHSRNFWKKMYKNVLKDRRVWNDICVNKNKNGEIYWVDSYIKATFNPLTDEHTGFISIRQDVTEIFKVLNELDKKTTYLEHAAKILRHDMHSGINTYIPRGISSLERRLKQDIIKQYKLEAPLKLIKEGLKHSQKVYKGVYDFTNLVKKDAVLEKEPHDLKLILKSFLESTSYSDQVIINDLCVLDVNESLFCTAIDNLIRNGLKYNDSPTKVVKLYMEDASTLVVEDNGRGLTQDEFEQLAKPYSRKKGQKESGTGLGLNICVAILKEHGFKIYSEKVGGSGTKMKINITEQKNTI